MKKVILLMVLLAASAASFCFYGQEPVLCKNKDGRYGFIDQTGAEVIPFKYDYAANFSNGQALVQLYGKWGYINEAGAEVILCKYDHIENIKSTFYCYYVRIGEKWGIVDLTNSIIVPIKYKNEYEAYNKLDRKIIIAKETNGKYKTVLTQIEQANNFASISSSTPTTQSGNQNISTINLTVNSSDIDVNIPINKNTNDKTFAVIIANENYRREEPVVFAQNDGETFKKYCIKTLGLPEKNVHLTINATLNDIRAEINWISNVADAFKGEANIIFYYVGHGIPDESSKTAYLLPFDGYGSDVTTGYKLDDLYSKLGTLPVKNIIVFTDACFSGAQRSGKMLASARGVAIKALAGKPVGNMVVFSAAQGDETAFPYIEKGHGMFTYFLLKKLQESKGEATLSELGNYIIDNVRQQSIIVNSKIQTPTVTASTSVGDKWQGMKLK